MLQAYVKRALLYYLQDFVPRIFTHSASFDAGAFLILSEDVHEDSLTVVFENNWYIQEQMIKNHVDGG
uniref:Agenet-like domain-containing protein n=1 Tax=Moschus moschiferus TaxID=68415 RepID=A0A8C6E0M0_MOSMO